MQLDNIYFVENQKLTKSQINKLCEIVKKSHNQNFLYPSFEYIIYSKTIKFCCVFNNNKIVSFAIYMFRKWKKTNLTLKTLSIGYITTLPEFRGRGYATFLLSNVENLAKSKKIDFIYLQGIQDFYGKYGFKGFAPKSKFIFYKKDFISPEGQIVDLQNSNKNLIKKLHYNFFRNKEIYIKRDNEIWEDFFSHLKNTYLFYKPKIVLDKTLKPIIYFCTTPNEETTIREFIPCNSIRKVEKGLSLIFKEFGKIEKIEIFSDKSGIINELALTKGADFFQYIRPNGSNMIKIINKNINLKDLEYSFIFQGDNS
ncbi:GNAT family N-acetyltransferase [Prochlorococcus marinus XMU1412]|uniref:GNAT family N-acetyltransferase n=1 Tax=Prochlorococcus marinus TaxID=1219 RepID=UPI001ADB907C|nr:GNAT family N-acetyltransferase [Prochlorococcus marinus]MBO8240559.1 GNAT family N-acetyltransferase [Prochlorococcus marinus XMU1412]MBW3071794.1 hypothetical protein [Prochlorococcus marinus str. MU1412]